MSAKQILSSESTLTDRYQTTVPAPVRDMLGLEKGDKICYSIQSDRQVVISRVEETEDDPILGKFLDFIAQDLESHPERLPPMTSDFIKRAESLIDGVDIDLDAPLSDEDE